MGKVLITCTEPRASEIAQTISNAFSHPALAVERLQTLTPNGDFDAILVTSRHAICNNLPDLPVIAVGNKTADTLKNKGYNVIQTGTGGVQDLDLLPYQNILYPCAVEPTIIPDNATAWPVYETKPHPDFTIPDSIDAIALFSIKGAKHVLSCATKDYFYLCLSDAIADTIKGQKLAVAEKPSYHAIKELIEDYTRGL